MLHTMLLFVAPVVHADASWAFTPNAAIEGYNNEHVSGSVDYCKQACESRSWCKSFDYYRNDNACDLSDKTAKDVGGLKTDYRGNPFDHYEIVTPECSKIVMTDFKTTGSPSQSEDANGSTVVHDYNNCQQSSDATIDRKITAVRTESVTDSYSNAETWSKTFSSKVGAKVGMKIEGGFFWGKASASVEVDTSFTSTGETGGSATSTNVKQTIKSYEGQTTYHIVVPAFTWKDITVTWQKFQLNQAYTATALCKDENDNVIEKKTVSGKWKGAYLTQSKVMTKDITDECPTAQKCECAGLVASYARQGIECTSLQAPFGTGEFCYVRTQAPCAHKDQLDALDYPVSASLFKKSGDPCGSSPTFVASEHFTSFVAVSSTATEEPTCSTLFGDSLSAPGDSRRIIFNGRCGLWTCKDDGSFDVAQCPAVEKQSGDCIIGGQVVKNSETLPLIYGSDGCITATCRNEELDYSQCDDTPASSTCDEMPNGDQLTTIDANGICIEAECETNGMTIYTSCVPSNDECILPNYETLADGKSRVVYDEQGVCSKFACNNGILDVHSCAVIAPPSNSTGEHVEGSLAAPLEQVGRLMDRLGNYLTHQGFRR